MRYQNSKTSDNLYHEVALSEILTNKMNASARAKSMTLATTKAEATAQYYIMIRVSDLWEEEYKLSRFLSLHYLLNQIKLFWHVRSVPGLVISILISFAILCSGVFPRYVHTRGNVVLDHWTGDLDRQDPN